MTRILLLLITILFISPVIAQTTAEKKRMVAILDLRDRNNENDTRLFGVEQIAIAAGFPYIITRNLDIAEQYGMILSSSDFQTYTFSDNEVDQLRSFVNNGGILVTSNVKDPRFNDIFGISSYTTSRTNYSMNFDMSTNDSTLIWFDDPREQEVILGKRSYPEVIFTRHYRIRTATALAYFENDVQRPAIVMNEYGNGVAYGLGYSLRDVSLRHMLNYDYNAERHFSNSFEPNADVHILFLRSIYTKHGKAKVWKHTSPANSYSTVMVTHDVDSRTGMDTMLIFSEWQRQQGLVADYNITTRYFRDAAMSDFYNGRGYLVDEVIRDGHVINSHSVGHFFDFHEFKMGPYGATSSTYTPYYDGDSTDYGYVLPEVQVSKNILEGNHNVKVRCFRAGHLRYPKQLANALDTLGYEYESTLSTNDIGWSFPFPIKKNRSFSGEVTNVYEVSMTLSDVIDGGINKDNWPGIVSSWVIDSWSYADNHSPVNHLMHPNRRWKLDAQREYLKQLGPKFIKTNMAAYGDYWRKRMTVDFASTVSNDTLFISVNDNDYPLSKWFSFMAEGSDQISEVIVRTQSGINIPMNVERQGHTNRMIIYNGSVSVGEDELIAEDAGIRVYPNPSSGIINVSAEVPLRDATVTLYDLTGREIMQEAVSGSSHQLETRVETGIYLLRITQKGKEIASRKIIIE